jgi:hypothetical protein
LAKAEGNRQQEEEKTPGVGRATGCARGFVHGSYS